jgi:predicted HicB family RNase H-like nuclease
MSTGVHGEDEAEVYRELCQVVEEWVAIHETDGAPLPPATAGKDYSGKFMLRTGEALHKELAIRALREGMSLNSYCVKQLREGG